MSPADAKDVVLRELLAVVAASSYAGMPVAMPDQIFKPTRGVSHAIATMRHVASVQATQGSEGNRKFERFYMLMVAVRAPGGEGSNLVDTIADVISRGLQGKQLSGANPGDQVIIGVVEPNEPLVSDPAWSQVTLFVPFQFYDLS